MCKLDNFSLKKIIRKRFFGKEYYLTTTFIPSIDFTCDSEAASPSTLFSLSRFSEKDVNVGSAASFFSCDPLDEFSDDFSTLMDLADGPFSTFTAGDAFAELLGGDFLVGEIFEGESCLLGVLPKNRKTKNCIFMTQRSRKAFFFCHRVARESEDTENYFKVYTYFSHSPRRRRHDSPSPALA